MTAVFHSLLVFSFSFACIFLSLIFDFRTAQVHNTGLLPSFLSNPLSLVSMKRKEYVYVYIYKKVKILKEFRVFRQILFFVIYLFEVAISNFT
jgi:hypothetical protein